MYNILIVGMMRIFRCSFILNPKSKHVLFKLKSQNVAPAAACVHDPPAQMSCWIEAILLPVHEPLQASQLLTNLLMLDWNYMLEPQRLQSAAALVRPNRVMEETWVPARLIKHGQLPATRSNHIVTGLR